MTDIFERIQKNSMGPLGQYASKAFGYFMYPKLEGELGPHMKFQGRDVLCWSLNNYLGLANHPEVRKTGRCRGRCQVGSCLSDGKPYDDRPHQPS